MALSACWAPVLDTFNAFSVEWFVLCPISRWRKLRLRELGLCSSRVNPVLSDSTPDSFRCGLLMGGPGGSGEICSLWPWEGLAEVG